MTVASIDIGTNTVLMVVAEYDSATKNIQTILNEYRIPRLGKALKPGNPITDDKVLELIKILTEYKNIADKFNCKKIILTATHAFRIASNSTEIVNLVKKQLELEIDIISGKSEAMFSYLGATGNLYENDYAVVIDIGGGSTEIVYGKNNNILFTKSFKLGVVNGTENFLNVLPYSENDISLFEKEIEKKFCSLTKINFLHERAIAIAGTPTTLACIQLGLKEFDESKIEGYTLSKADLSFLVKNIAVMSPEEIQKEYKAVVKGREDVLFAGSFILLKLMDILKLNHVQVSTKGIRYGAIINAFLKHN